MIKQTLQEDGNLHWFLALDPRTFDQDPQKWWRSIQSAGMKEFIFSWGKNTQSIHNALRVMIHYLEHYDFSKIPDQAHFKPLLERHIWQAYAMAWEYDKAVLHMQKLYNEWYKGVWTRYMQATIAFLQRDKETLKNLSEISWDEESNNMFITQFYNNFEKTYVEAYGGISFEEAQKNM